MGTRSHTVVLLALGIFWACAPRPGPGATGPATSDRGMPLGTLEISRGDTVLISFNVEIAETEAHRVRGLMGVQDLPRNEGMVFLFDTPTRHSFWMKDTLIPLQIAFWNGDGAIVQVLAMPLCSADPCPSYSADSDVVGALEVNDGVLSRASIQAGDKARLSRTYRKVQP